MTSVYSVETSSLAFVTPPSSPPPEFEDNFDNFSGVQTPTQRNSLSSPKQSSASPGVIANHITPPLIHRAPSSTVEITLASAVGTSSSSTSKKSPVPVQTFPTFLEPMKAGSTSEDAISVLEDSLERSLKIAQDPLTSKSISSKSKPEARIHPFAHSTAQLELLPSSTHTTAHGIDLEEEARLYAELMEGNNEDGVYEDMTEDFTRHNTPRFRTLSTPVKPSLGKLPKHKPPLPPLRNSVQNASIAGPSSASPSSNLRTASSPVTHSHSLPPLDPQSHQKHHTLNRCSPLTSTSLTTPRQALDSGSTHLSHLHLLLYITSVPTLQTPTHVQVLIPVG
ncbi:hypothetical protein CPB83DRAFT_109828 [Crepidotus variabilis]|uniref:Uncharacterized protein n=1 Tax=Crepidotus variabilis TaxID=179855 RepID=A0A9P6EM18_9AGAR|nr:hypothetical protein CPB83DRAFT_109828 [Crepidotus variabilis]